MNTELKDALVNVRKAYRLIADYQQRILDLLSFIKNEFGAIEYSYNYLHGDPRSSRLDKGKRFLPLNDASIIWIKHSGKQDDYTHYHSTGDMLIDIKIRNDTGNGAFDEPIQLAEDSVSELRIYIFLCVTPMPTSHNWYSKVWQKTKYPLLGEVIDCEGSPGYKAYGEALNLENLFDEQSVRQALVDFKSRATEKFGHTI